MAGQDQVREFLTSKGCDPQVVERGSEGLLKDWEKIVAEVSGGSYALGLDDYLNDMDAREILEGALEASAVPVAPAFRARLEAADARFQAHTVAAPRCLWGEALADDHDWTPQTHWWYYRYPRKHHAEFGHDLRATGIEVG